MHRLYLWPHRALYVGTSPDNELHRHHAAQICISMDQPLIIREAAGDAPRTMAGVFIAPDHPHRIDAGGARVVAIYLEPESDEYAALVEPLRCRSTTGIAPLAVERGSIESLRQLVDGNYTADLAWNLCARELGFGFSPPRPPDRDHRVEKVLESIRAEPGKLVPAYARARMVHLSPGRFAHLFKSEVGVPLRRFVVWTRIREVISQAMVGASLTEAAYAAGFSDAAHMSNSFRQMFGFAPSKLFASNVEIDVSIVD